jgi:hypothetical protein
MIKQVLFKVASDSWELACKCRSRHTVAFQEAAATSYRLLDLGRLPVSLWDDDDDGSFANLQVGRSTNTKDWFYFRTTLMIG